MHHLSQFMHSNQLNLVFFNGSNVGDWFNQEGELSRYLTNVKTLPLSNGLYMHSVHGGLIVEVTNSWDQFKTTEERVNS